MTKTKATVKSRKKRMEKFPFVLKRAVGSVVGRGQIAVGWRMSRMFRSADTKCCICEKIGLWTGKERCISSVRWMCYPGKTLFFLRWGDLNMFNGSQEWCRRKWEARVAGLFLATGETVNGGLLVSVVMVDCEISHVSPCIFKTGHERRRNCWNWGKRGVGKDLRKWRRFQRIFVVIRNKSWLEKQGV